MIFELFAGAGGMSEALRLAGLSASLAVELDPLACSTARAAGHDRLCADVAALDPTGLTRRRSSRGLLAAPPCQGFSGGGLKLGHSDLPLILDAIPRIGRGRDMRAALAAQARDQRSVLVTEPLRWALALRPQWIVLEQVPSVLPVWQATGRVLSEHGWHVDTAIVNAADHGVPQDRPRAVLLASRSHPVQVPLSAGDDLAGRPGAATVVGPGLLGFPRRADKPTGVVAINGVLYRSRDLRRTELPAYTLTGKCRSWSFWPDEGGQRQLTLTELGQLQSFRPSYPWQGKRTPATLQIANAHPPLLGLALLREVL